MRSGYSLYRPLGYTSGHSAHRSWEVRAQLARCARSSSSDAPPVLWPPGRKAPESQTDLLAGKIGTICRSTSGLCVIGARGELSTARAMRALAKGSDLGKSPLEFRVRWHEEPNDERSLRFYTEIRYTWTAFKKSWKRMGGEVRVLTVTPHTSVHKLATAVVIEERRSDAVALKLNSLNDSVLATAAKALATLPHLAQMEARGADLVCVLRWPTSQEALYLYAHIFDMSRGPVSDRQYSDGVR